MGLSWFPGHMAKAVGEIRQSMKLIDVVIEILDARAPRATANPYLDEALGTKPRVLVLNKADLADARSTQAWLEALREKSVAAAPADCQRGAGVKEAIKLAEQVAQSSGLDGGGGRLRRRFGARTQVWPGQGGLGRGACRSSQRDGPAAGLLDAR